MTRRNQTRTSSGISAAAREQRTVAVGAATVVIALLLAFVALPLARRWQSYAIELQRTRDQIQEYAALANSAGALDAAGSANEQRLASQGRRVIRARSATLAASALQSFLQDASDASRLVVTRLDVAPPDGGPDSSATGAVGVTSVPATLAAYGDITGLAELLHQLSHGPRVVRVERMTVQQNSALRGAPDMLQITLTLRAPVVLE